ncbi:MAG TPA: flagellar biosynthesis protein FlhB [Rhodocyclaceae bacterium]|nr:flagellar biosynthesis protein FlhB [Rhodocyclaceae bacterium]
MADDSDLERTEQPTGRRIEQAREKGQVPHSRELGSFLVLLVAAAVFWMMGGWFMERSMAITRKGLTLNVDATFLAQPTQMLTRFSDLSMDALLAFAPMLAVLLLASILPPFLLNAWVFAPKMPDLGRLNPIAGLSRIFSWNGLMELAKAAAKAVLVGGVGVFLIWRERDDMLGLLAQPLETGLAHAGHLVVYSFLLLVLALALVVAADVPFQLWHHFNQLKMTKEEVKQEAKEMEGDPHVKGRIRSLQLQAAKKRMMAAVPKADVIVTNPTHFAVALSYKAGMAAPKVVAKGMGEVARRIKEIGAEHGVPMLEAPPLARALHKHADLDAEIPSALYTAVAEVLAYVYQLSNWRSVGGAYPNPPRDLQVPPELVPEAA